ncbi:hypothetical protein AGIG_G16616 [Arapaima gigas]
MAAPAWANTFGRDSRPGAGALAPPPYGPGGASVTDGYTAHGRTWAGGTTPAAGRCGQVSESQPLAWAALMEPPPPEVRRVPEADPPPPTMFPGQVPDHCSLGPYLITQLVRVSRCRQHSRGPLPSRPLSVVLSGVGAEGK